jgi:hypothetical protein
MPKLTLERIEAVVYKVATLASSWFRRFVFPPAADTSSETWASASSVITASGKVKQKMRILRPRPVTLSRSSREQGRPRATRILEILRAARAGDLGRVKELLEHDPRLLRARDPMGNTTLIVAVNSGHHEVAELLLSTGIRLDIHEADARREDRLRLLGEAGR